jgi:hypothetical protein
LTRIIFYRLSSRLSWSHYPVHEFGMLTQVIFLLFFNLFFLISSFTFDWFRIKFHNFFLYFSFYKVISISLPKSWIWRINMGWLKLFFIFVLILSFNIKIVYSDSSINSHFLFFFCFFFQFHSSIDLELNFNFYFYFYFL